MVFRASYFGLSTLVRWICDSMDAQRVVKNTVPYIIQIVLSTMPISGVTFSEHCTPQISSAQLVYKTYSQYRHHYHIVTVAWPVLQLVYVASIRHSKKHIQSLDCMSQWFLCYWVFFSSFSPSHMFYQYKSMHISGLADSIRLKPQRSVHHICPYMPISSVRACIALSPC